METYTDRQRQAFADALKSHFTELDREGKVTLAQAMGYASPSAISNWTNPDNTPPAPPVLIRLEVEMGLEPGQLTWHLGYLPRGSDVPACTVEAAISEDPALDKTAKTTLRSVYRSLVSREVD